MTQLGIYSLLLALTIQHGVFTQASLLLDDLQGDVRDVTCSGNLQCESSNTFCMPGELYPADHPVLVPTNIRSKTMKKCNESGCRLCLQVIMDISVAFISEDAEELGSGGCDYEDSDYHEPWEEEDTNYTPDLRPSNSSNGSYLCADVYITQPSSLSCHRLKVSLPQNLVPQRTDTSSVKVGSLMYNYLMAIPGIDVTLAVFTCPRYFEELNLNHEFPKCNQLDSENRVLECEVPDMDPNIFDRDNVSIGLTNKTRHKNVTLYRFFNSSSKAPRITETLCGAQRYSFPKSDIVPCLCFHLYYQDPPDSPRNKLCPFQNYSEEITLNRSRLVLELYRNVPYYNLSSPCNITAELSLCWKNSDLSGCREFPHSRKWIKSETKEPLTLEIRHPSICLQVSVKGKVLHTNCSIFTGTHRASHEEAIVFVSQPNSTNMSVCLAEDNSCNILYNSTQMRAGAGLLEQWIVQDILADRCMTIWKSDRGDHVYVCPLDKYVRSTWNWSRILTLLAVAFVLLILLLHNDRLKKWIKSVSEERDLGDIFRERRLLILYSPDSPEYERLVRVFASSLKELKLDVVLDQWHHVEISGINLLPWYHLQKSLVSEKKGLILLLFSAGAQERYAAWKGQQPEGMTDFSFGAVLNCVHSDFKDRTARGLYLVGFFSFYSQSVVPELFRSVPAYSLPSNLSKLLREVAGDAAKKFRRNQVNRLTAEITKKLLPPMTVCQNAMFHQTSSSTSGSTTSDRSVTMELQPLV